MDAGQVTGQLVLQVFLSTYADRTCGLTGIAKLQADKAMGCHCLMCFTTAECATSYQHHITSQKAKPQNPADVSFRVPLWACGTLSAG